LAKYYIISNYQRLNVVTETIGLQVKDQVTDSFMLSRDVIYMALFGPSNDDLVMDQHLFNRNYSTFLPNTEYRLYNIDGNPEITNKNQGVTFYNGNPNIKYQNSLQGFLTDQSDDLPDESAIYSINTQGATSIVLKHEFDKTIEELYTESTLNDPDGLLLIELTLSPGQIAVSNIYGGNSFEDKSRTSYLKIGDYTDINTTSVQIDNAGDTFVYPFKVARLIKTDSKVLDDQVLQLAEIIEFPVETEVDLKNRNDNSLFSWDTEFQPTYDRYFQYNKVYSQQPSLLASTPLEFTFRRVRQFDTRIQSSKLKIPNETVDSWTDVLSNEFIDLEGAYGPINHILTFKDNLFSFQDKGIAKIAVNPRVQVQGQDGFSIELGKGDVLYRKDYLTTNSGSINKWGIIAGKRGIYYYDALNRGLGRIPNETEVLLSDASGMHSFFNSNYDYDSIVVDNPLNNAGVVLGRDNYNSDIFITVLQKDKSFTWVFNELTDSFIDRKTYTPSRYINLGEKLLIPPTGNNTDLWEQYNGEYNNFFGETEDSFITFQFNPEPTLATTFNTLEFTSETYIDRVDQPFETYTHIRAFNEYQDSGEVPFIYGKRGNLKRRMRMWSADIPREGRNRVKNPWTYLTLKLENTDNKEVILNDITLNYTV